MIESVRYTSTMNRAMSVRTYGDRPIPTPIAAMAKARLVLILATIVLWLSSTLVPGMFREVRFAANAVVLVMALAMFGSLVLRFAKNLHRLAKEEPRKRWRDRHRRAQEEAAKREETT